MLKGFGCLDRGFDIITLHEDITKSQKQFFNIASDILRFKVLVSMWHNFDKWNFLFLRRPSQNYIFWENYFLLVFVLPQGIWKLLPIVKFPNKRMMIYPTLNVKRFGNWWHHRNRTRLSFKFLNLQDELESQENPNIRGKKYVGNLYGGFYILYPHTIIFCSPWSLLGVKVFLWGKKT